jgi:FKBP12-rapamycin complex-associated protein
MDERAMAFFGLVNQLLSAAPQTAQEKLSIIRYSITPLSPRCGLIGWVPDCDTLHTLIRQYRHDNKVCAPEILL